MRLDAGYPVRFIVCLLQTAAAYKAKLLCSGIFVSGRKARSLLVEDLAVDDLAPLRALKANVDYAQKTVTVSLFGLCQRTALYRPGLGSTLVLDTTVEGLRSQSASFSTWLQHHPSRLQSLPTAQASSLGDRYCLKAVTNRAFEEENSSKQKRTRAVVVVHRGKIVAERYAAGFSAQTPMLGWSLAKSVVNALVGILVRQGKLSLADSDLIAEWRQPGDARRCITLEQLLRMSSGLQFSEAYGNPLSDVITLLFHREDGARYAAQQPLAQKPGSVFHYASGTTVLLCRIIREAVGGTLADYFAFPRQALFDPLGMASAVLEPDSSGTFVGSSFMYATARDWAKLGLLHLQEGRWKVEGQWVRILPEGWAKFSSEASQTADFYGAHFWRGVPDSFTVGDRDTVNWPKDAYLASGYQGQFVTIVPSADLVVVRLGLSQRKNSWDHAKFIESVVQTLQRQA